MNRPKSTSQPTNQDKPLLSSFLYELNIARRQLALYPTDHPQIKSSIEKTLSLLNELFQSNPTITLGIAPDGLLFERLWLDKDDSNHTAFAEYFSALGIASVSFHEGLKGPELIRFNQLLRSDRDVVEASGGFSKLLDQQQIEHISVIPIDYDAFQASQNFTEQQDQLWETFLHGLQNGILDFGDTESDFDLTAIADVLNQRLVDNTEAQNPYAESIDLFIEKRLRQDNFSSVTTATDRKFNALLEQLNPEVQDQLFTSIFGVLDRHQDAAPGLLKKIPAQLLQNAIARKSQQNSKISSRLLSLAKSLANGPESTFNHKIQTGPKTLSHDMVRARLDVLFSEEQQDLYMPSNYQAALGQILSNDISGSIPDDEKLNLKKQLETQPIERNFVAILGEMLQEPLDSDQEDAVQQNLIELSRYFLDTGDFISLSEIYRQWSHYLYSDKAHASIFDEKVLANHTQTTFMTEVLDSFELWEEPTQNHVSDYIVTVGDPYGDLLIEQLGRAPSWPERQRWISILENIGGDTQQKILASLNDRPWYLVRNLLTVLSRYLDPKSIKVVQQLSEHPHPKVRQEAIRILFSCNPATANRQLLMDLRNNDLETRLTAVQIADLSRDPTVLALLHKYLDKEPSTDTEVELISETIRTLTRIGNRESIPVLRRILKKQGLLVSRRTKQLQAEIIRNLATFPGSTAEKLLQELTSGKFKQLAKEALEQRQ